MKGRRVLLLVLVGFVSFLSGGWLLQRGTSRQGSVYERARLFEDVLAHIAEYAVDSLDEGELYDMAIDGLIEQLDDPYALYLRPDDYRQLTERTTGNYGGLGMQIDVRDGWITVIAPMASTPAEAAGIEPGDRIMGVEGESTFGWKIEKAVVELRGEPGTSVLLSIGRPGVPESLEFNLTRAVIHVRSVRTATVLGPAIGYLSLAYSTISEKVTEEVAEELSEMAEQGARALILDLRNTPGGLLDQGVALADLFLDPEQVVVDTRGRTPSLTQTYRTQTRQRWSEMPIVVLVNGGTASAAEIIAGALQDHDRAVILGTPTFGKGLVQTVFRLAPQEALQLTTGRWYTPSGRTIQRPIRRVGRTLRIVGGFEEEREDRLGDTTVVDSSAVFHTDAGRAIVGGGGIRPDVTVRLDTLTDAEQVFSRTLGARIPAYRDVMTTYALDMKGAAAVTQPDFQVTSAMRAEFVRRLRERGIQLPREVLDGASSLIKRQLGYEVTRYVFGREVESRRRIRDDAQVREALELLGAARTPAELFALIDQDTRLQGSSSNR